MPSYRDFVAMNPYAAAQGGPIAPMDQLRGPVSGVAPPGTIPDASVDIAYGRTPIAGGNYAGISSILQAPGTATQVAGALKRGQAIKDEAEYLRQGSPTDWERMAQRRRFANEQGRMAGREAWGVGEQFTSMGAGLGTGAVSGGAAAGYGTAGLTGLATMVPRWQAARSAGAGAAPFAQGAAAGAYGAAQRSGQLPSAVQAPVGQIGGGGVGAAAGLATQGRDLRLGVPAPRGQRPR